MTRSLSLSFPPLRPFPLSQNEDLRRNSSRMDSERSKTIVRLLQSATNNTQRYYGNDVKTAAQLLNHVLQYESRQAGFELTAMRDAEFNEVEAKTNRVKAFNFVKPSLSHWEHWWHAALHWLSSYLLDIYVMNLLSLTYNYCGFLPELGASR